MPSSLEEGHCWRVEKSSKWGWNAHVCHTVRIEIQEVNSLHGLYMINTMENQEKFHGI